MYVFMHVQTLSSQSECAVSISKVFSQVGKELLHQLPFGIILKVPECVCVCVIVCMHVYVSVSVCVCTCYISSVGRYHDTGVLQLQWLSFS